MRQLNCMPLCSHPLLVLPFCFSNRWRHPKEIYAIFVWSGLQYVSFARKLMWLHWNALRIHAELCIISPVISANTSILREFCVNDNWEKRQTTSTLTIWQSGIFSCRRDRLQHISIIFVYSFVLKAFVNISYFLFAFRVRDN